MQIKSELKNELTFKSPYRPEIDGLRALAVVAVIINHFSAETLPSGYLGVDIFFVISGYVITGSLTNHRSSKFSDFFLDFYIRRIKRLVPALVLYVVVAATVICLFDPVPTSSLRTGLASLFGLSNLYLLHSSTEYFASSTELNVFTHTWSLGVEEQFYVFFPILLWLTSRAAAGGVKNLFRITGVLSLISLVTFALFYQTNQVAVYFLMPTRLWELGSGCILFLGMEQHRNRFIGNLERVPSLFATAGILGVLFVPLNFAVPATIMVVVLSVILLASLRPGTVAYRIFTRPHVVLIGLISYSLYLWHWGVLCISRWTIGMHWWIVPIQVAIIFLVALASYHFIEAPLRRTEWSTRRFLSIGYGASASMSACGLIFVLLAPWSERLYLGRIMSVPVPPNLQRTWWKDRQSGRYLEKCHLESDFASDLLAKCLNVIPGVNGTLFLVGDSHARNYLPTVRNAFRDHSVGYITMGWGCAFLPYALSRFHTEVHCPSYVEETERYLLKKVRKGDIVIVGQMLFEESRQSPIYIDFIKKFARRLGERQVPLVLLDGTYPPKRQPEQCFRAPWRPFGLSEECFVTTEAVAKAFAKFDQLASDASKEVETLFYAPLRMGLCNEGLCGQYSKTGLPIWHDRGHITEEAAAELTPLLLFHLKQQGFYARFTEQLSLSGSSGSVTASSLSREGLAAP